MFGFKKNKKESEPLVDHPLVDMLMKASDEIMERGHMTQDSIAFVKMAIRTAKMKAQYEMELYSFVVDECEKMVINCKDERFKKMEEVLIDKMKTKIKDMRNDHNKLTVSYDKLKESLDNVMNDMKSDDIKSC